MNLYSFSILCFAFGVTIIAILVSFKRRDFVAKRFLWFSVSVCGWGYFSSLWISGSFSYERTLWFDKLSHVSAVFIPITWAHFVFSFINKKEPLRYFYVTCYIFSTLLSVCAVTPYFLAPMRPFQDIKYFTMAGPLYHYFIAYFYGLIGCAFYCLFRAYRSAEGELKQKLKYLVLGTAMGFTAGGLSILPIYGIPFPQYSFILMPFYPIFTGIALIKYGLFDVQQIADAFQREKLAAIGTMAASLNHELRNPLYIAKGRMESYIEGVKEGIYSDKNQRQANADKTIEIASTHLARAMDIMQRFSDFAKPFNSRKDKERINLNQAFKSVFELVSNEFQMQKIQLKCQTLEGIYVQANLRQLEEILFNLIINACHSMEEKGGELTVKTYPAGGKIIIEVADSGTGIGQEALRQIFEPFYSTKGEKGSGLGLYITKQLVEKNSGKISVKSKPGIGTTFRLEFPIE